MLQTFESAQPSRRYGASSTASDPTPITNADVSKIKPALEMSTSGHHHIFIVTGPAGCGKSTVAKFLAERYAFEYIEGDDYHPQANVDKMAKNIPLDDADRWDWLILLRDQALSHLKQGAKGVVVTCSALKKKYRDVIRTARLYDEDPNTDVTFVYLQADLETLLDRVGSRKNHYMKADMVKSQMATLEEPDKEEIEKLKDIRIINVKGSPEEVQKLVSSSVDELLVGDGAGNNSSESNSRL